MRIFSYFLVFGLLLSLSQITFAAAEEDHNLVSVTKAASKIDTESAVGAIGATKCCTEKLKGGQLDDQTTAPSGANTAPNTKETTPSQGADSTPKN